jgi:anti-sigma regulatory factor (Ser/Thr protein kinase)
MTKDSELSWKETHKWQIAPNRAALKRALAELRSCLPCEERLKIAVLTVADELLRNGLEHGCFGLSSEAKSALLETGGFEAYLKKLEEEAGDRPLLRLEAEIGNELVLTVTDPGPGFEVALAPIEASEKPSGRGIHLARSLATTLTFSRNPSSARAVFLLGSQKT